MADRPIVVDLFAGAGGLSLGFEQAGFRVAAAVELDPIHAAVHAYNFPRTAVLPRSVVGLSGREIRSRAGIGRAEIAVVVGGAPCQGFSLIGQRALDDPRNSLVREFVRIVKELRPRHFLFENVKGLTLGAHRSFLHEVLDAFAEAKYSVRLPWRVLNAVDFGVPQHRERLFLMGARSDCDLPAYPESISYAPGSSPVPGRSPSPTALEAIGDLPNADDYHELLVRDSVRVTGWRVPSDYARMLRGTDGESWYFGERRSVHPQLLTSSMRTAHSSISRRRFAKTTPGTVEPISRFLRLSPTGVSNTLRAGSDAARGAFTSPRPIHYEYPRCITVREMARLHGFPDWFRFHTTKWHGAREIGNSVAPPIARQLASQFAEAMAYVPRRPRGVLELGDEQLLSLDLAGASEHWGIPAIIARRDRKSPFRKRSQAETEDQLRKSKRTAGSRRPR